MSVTRNQSLPMAILKKRKSLVNSFLIWVSKEDRPTEAIRERLLHLMDVTSADESIDFLERLERNSTRLETKDSRVVKGYGLAVRDFEQMIFPETE